MLITQRCVRKLIKKCPPDWLERGIREVITKRKKVTTSPASMAPSHHRSITV